MEREWFLHPEWWFYQSVYDELMIEKFSHLLDEHNNTTLSNQQRQDDFIEQILVYDQLPRHMFRHYGNHITTYFLQKALEILKNKKQSDFDRLDDDRLCFALLPLRHSLEHTNICRALELCWNRVKAKNYKDCKVLQRFLKATYQRMPLVGPSLTSSDQTNMTDDRDVPFEIIIANPKPFRFQFDLKKESRHKNIVVSLSGGVDSMIASWMLHRSGYKISAIHVNYTNRPTSDEEMRFVMAWCRFLDISCYTRRLTEIQRPPCMQVGLREIYESYTRNVRYHCYKSFGKDTIIVLGHNKDDVMENIFTNIAHKSKYDNLSGMLDYSSVDDITFWRPMLNVPKADIIAFAKSCNIPHLPNSTPIWCQRGQIRNNIVPVLDKWDPKFIDSLYHLADTLSELFQIMEMQVSKVLESLESRVTCSNGNTIMMFDIHLSCDTGLPTIFWKMLFSKLGVPISVRSFQNLSNRLEKQTKTSCYREGINEACNNTCKIILNRNDTIEITRDTNILKNKIYRKS